jgi:hypothetical protein
MRTALEILKTHPDKGWWGASEESIVAAMEEYAKDRAWAAYDRGNEQYWHNEKAFKLSFQRWWEENK